MATHKIKAVARTDDGREITVLPLTLSSQVKCMVQGEEGIEELDLDEVLNQYAEEINENTSRLEQLEEKGDSSTEGGGTELLTSQPDFWESNETSVAFENVEVGAAVTGAGWTLSGSTAGLKGAYYYASGNTGVLSFPVTFEANQTYIISFTCPYMLDANKFFNIILASSTTATSGIEVGAYGKSMYGSSTVLIESKYKTNYLNIVPKSEWSGSFSLNSVTKAVSVNSHTLSKKGVIEVVKGASMASGGGLTLTTAVNSGNTAIGYQAMQNGTSGGSNTAIGCQAMQNNTVGNSNTAIGADAMRCNTNGTDNTAIGVTALFYNTVGGGDTAIGYAALYKNTSGNVNIATGGYSMYENITGICNTANGFSSFRNNKTGRNNTAIGYSAGSDISSGSAQTTANDSVFIGAETRGGANDDQKNQIVIGYNARGNGSNTITLGNDQITHIYAQVTELTKISDKRVKENIEPANLQMCYDDVKRLNFSL